MRPVTPVAIILLLIAAFAHAGWNVVGKKEHPSAAFFLLASLTGVVLMLMPVLVWQASMIERIPARVWICLPITGIFQAAYYGSLAGAYRTGEMSIAYPVARSSPLIIVTIVSLCLQQGREIGTGCLAGIVMVVGGCFLLPMDAWSDFRVRNYLNRSCALALLAAFATAGYTLTDNWALKELRQIEGVSVAGGTVLYSLLESVTASAWLGVYVLVLPYERGQLSPAWRGGRWRALLMGVGVVVAYTLTLISFAYVRNVSYAAAFRQVSILVGVFFSAWLLHERISRQRWVGTVVIFLGLILIAIG